jgi:cytochrome c oxidase subunit 4
MASIQSMLRRKTAARANRQAGVTTATATAGHGHGGLGHVMPIPVLAGVLAALLVLTVITVAVTWVDLGRFNIWLALLIAVVKAALVCLYFMHLRYDNPFNAIALIASFLFVALFLAVAITDTREYGPNIQPTGRAPKPTAVAP